MREITIFAKKRTTIDGKKFYTYLTRLNKKDGSEVVASVKFREECGSPEPKTCPCFINIPDGGCNYSVRPYIDEASGMELMSSTLWVNEWEPGRSYIDTSMEDFI